MIGKRVEWTRTAGGRRARFEGVVLAVMKPGDNPTEVARRRWPALKRNFRGISTKVTVPIVECGGQLYLPQNWRTI